MNSYEYIEEVKRANGLDTDYKAAKMLGCGQNKITQYKNGQSMDNETARQFAEILEISVFEIIADMEVQRQKDPAKKKAWKTLAKMTRQAAFASPILLISLSFLTFVVNNIYYVK